MQFHEYLKYLSTDLGFAGIYPTLSLNWHHDVMSGELTDFASGKVKKLMILLPPLSSKTVFCSIALPSYLYYLYEGQEILSITGSQETSRFLGMSLGKVIESDIWQSLKKNPLADKRRLKQSFRLEDDSRFLGIPKGGVMAGHGPFHWLLIDDLFHNRHEADSVVTNRHILESFHTTMGLKMREEASVLVVASWWRRNDYIGELIATGKWRVLSIPAIADEDEEWEGGSGTVYERKEGAPLWPEKMSLPRLLDIKEHMGRDFEGLYQQRPVYSVGRITKHKRA